VTAYLLGLVTVPALIAIVVAVVMATETGTETSCTLCGYSTGDMRRTPRIVRWSRWTWHRSVTRRTSRCPSPRKTR
jgi:hypothetical protein